MAEHATVKLDTGGVNRRILARQAMADYRRVEQASIKQRICLRSPEAKRFFVRFFHSLQLNAHFVSDIARAHLSPADVESVEQTMRKRLEELTDEINREVDRTHVLFTSNAITGAATYDTVALDVEVGVISSFGRRYLEAIQAFDQLMPMLRTLEIYEVLSPKDLDARRAHYKKLTRRVVTAARELGKGLRKRMNELAAKEAGGGEANEVPTGTPRGDTRPGELREERSDWPGDEMTEEQKTPPAVLRAHGSPPALPPAAPHLATLPACQAEEQKAA